MKSIQFTVYTVATGAIVKSGDCMEVDILKQAGEGEAISAGEKVNDEIYYFVGGNATPRPQLGFSAAYTIAADGVATISLPLPAGSTIRHGETVWTDETLFSVSSDTPGSFDYTIEPPFPWRGPIKVTIHAA